MKLNKLVIACLASALLSSSAYADACGTLLTGTFPAAQARKLCATFPQIGVYSSDILPAANNTYDIGSQDLLWSQVWSYSAVLLRYGADVQGAATTYYKTRGAGPTSYTILTDGDAIGTLRFIGSDGSGFTQGAQIEGFVDGTPGVSDMPGAIRLQTTPDGSDTPLTRWTVKASGDLVSDSTSGGNLTLAVAGKKITVKGGGAAATAGTFTCNGTTGVVVSTTAASVTGMTIVFAPATISGSAGVGAPFVSAISAGVSFSAKCSAVGETSTYNWAMISVS